MVFSHRNGNDGWRWVQKDFLKEKLRVRERYWHPISTEGSRIRKQQVRADEPMDCIFPDGLAWRMYLPLIIYLVDLMEEQHKKADLQPEEHQSKRRNCQWVLLESVTDWMDHRSMSLTTSGNGIEMPPETPIPHERAKIQKLTQQRSNTVKVFMDLSVREGDGSDGSEDEWDLMQYEDMSVCDRSQNSLFRAGRLFHQFCTNLPINNNNSSRFFILSGDEKFVQRFPEEDGIQSILMKDLLEKLQKENLWLTKEKLDHANKLAIQCEEEYKIRNNPTRTLNNRFSVADTGVEEYWTEDRIQEGLRNNTLVKGRLNVTKDNIKEAVVLSGTAGGDSSSLFINQARGYFNRAFHQDLVVVQKLPKDEWTCPVGRRRLVHVQSDENDNSNVNNSLSDTSPPVPSGRVVAIAKEIRRNFVATMVDTPMNDETICLVVPMDVRIPKIRIKTNGWRRFLGQRLWVQVSDWEVGSNYPSGRCAEILGPIGDLETEITCLLKENQIELDPFSAAAQACLPLEGHKWKISPHEIAQRKDLRSSRHIFSVDPNGCQDIDDTFHAHRLPNGDIEVGVHIADVDYFVPHDSALDKEAQKRATTFYLVDRRFDMLPRVLSSDLCSLHGNVDRLAVSTIWTMSSDFKTVKSFWYGRTVIHNCQAMTYEQAHNIIHSKPPDDPSKPSPPPLTAGYPVSQSNIQFLKKDLSLLTHLARKLRKDREDIGGAVDLSSGDTGNELKFSLDENHNPVKVTPKKQLEIHQTVAELMIMANSWVAKTIFERFPTCALLRIHQSVDESRFDDLKEILSAGNVSFDGSSNLRLANSLKDAEQSSKSNSAVNSLFKSLATRAMSEAQYVSTGKIGGEEGLSHYGLGLEKYTHFTSPIRRYADIVVHRQLLLTLTTKKSKSPTRPPPGFDRITLDSLPGSKTISIIRGEGIADKSAIGDSNSSVQSSESETGRGTEPQTERATILNEGVTDMYSNQKVATICQTLNQQNRMAKLSSFECQGLFLSLYFRDHVEVTHAVVTNLRSNGFWAYIPKFDFRAPVYLSDINGVVQMDPGLFKLEASSGLEPTTGFASSQSTRRFLSGTCTLIDSSDDEHLEVNLRETAKKYQVRVLDVVTVNIFCDEWNAKSRVPHPRIHLVSDSSEKIVSSPKKLADTSHTKANANDEAESHKISKKSLLMKIVPLLSIYEEIENLVTPTNLDVEFRSPKTTPVEPSSKDSMIGRRIFGDFVNPDTRSAQQEASIQQASAAALERRNQAMASRAKQNEYDTTRRIESDVTSRMQRLAASRRNTKRGKNR